MGTTLPHLSTLAGPVEGGVMVTVGYPPQAPCIRLSLASGQMYLILVTCCGGDLLLLWQGWCVCDKQSEVLE